MEALKWCLIAAALGENDAHPFIRIMQLEYIWSYGNGVPDGCEGDTVLLVVERWIDFREFGCHLESVGLDHMDIVPDRPHQSNVIKGLDDD